MPDGAALTRIRVSTPDWLTRAAGLVVIVALLAGGITWVAAASIGDAARTIGTDAEPSVALALGMTATLADLNAAAIGDALTDPAASGTSRAFRESSAQLGDAIVAASRNITYGEAEAAPLRSLQHALAMYTEAVAESRYLGAGDPWVMSRRVQWASRVNQEFAAPAAQALADANAAVLEGRYARYTGTWLAGAISGLAALAVLAALLVAVQIGLLRRMRRVVNPPLAAATLLCAALAIWFGSQAVGAHSTLRAAKQDAYDSLHVLFAAKAAVSTVRADTSLWLMDPAVRTDAQARIAAGEQALIGDASHEPVVARALLGGLDAAQMAERSGFAARALDMVPKTGGLLGAELANVTFGARERDAATRSIAHLLDADDFVRLVQAQATRAPTAAVARWLSERPGGGVPTFAAVQSALDDTIAVNQSEFDRDTASILTSARLIAPVTAAGLAMVVLLSLAGLWLRLREYR